MTKEDQQQQKKGSVASAKVVIKKVETYIDKLAKPKQVTPKYDPVEADIKASQTGVRRGALNATPSNRVQALAVPSERKTTEKFNPEEIEIVSVQPGALNAAATDRTNNLALPKSITVDHNVEIYKEVNVKPEILSTLTKYVDLTQKSDYKKFFHKCAEEPEPVPMVKSEMYKKKYKPPKPNPKKEQKFLTKWCIQRSQPKRQFPPTEPPPRPVKPLKKLLKRLKKLAKQKEHLLSQKYSHVSVFDTGVKRRALLIKPSARLNELALPKHFSYIWNKENPYTVNRKALNGHCSPRCEQLAEPKQPIATKIIL